MLKLGHGCAQTCESHDTMHDMFCTSTTRAPHPFCTYPFPAHAEGVKRPGVGVGGHHIKVHADKAHHAAALLSCGSRCGQVWEHVGSDVAALHAFSAQLHVAIACTTVVTASASATAAAAWFCFATAIPAAAALGTSKGHTCCRPCGHTFTFAVRQARQG